LIIPNDLKARLEKRQSLEILAKQRRRMPASDKQTGSVRKSAYSLSIPGDEKTACITPAGASGFGCGRIKTPPP
jgi:hypothetical protein